MKLFSCIFQSYVYVDTIVIISIPVLQTFSWLQFFLVVGAYRNKKTVLKRKLQRQLVIILSLLNAISYRKSSSDGYYLGKKMPHASRHGSEGFLLYCIVRATLLPHT